MSKDDFKKFIPDTPREWSQIGSAINRLGVLITGIGALQEKFHWVLISLGCTWLGHEVSEYFKIYTSKSNQAAIAEEEAEEGENENK